MKNVYAALAALALGLSLVACGEETVITDPADPAAAAEQTAEAKGPSGKSIRVEERSTPDVTAPPRGAHHGGVIENPAG